MEDPDDLLCCCVCDQKYSDARFPRNLKCGHSVCSSCCEEIIRINKLCPECRTTFKERSAAELPVNYPLLRLSRLFASLKTGENDSPKLTLPVHASSSSESQQNAGKCPAHPECVMFFMCMRCVAFVCRQCIAKNHPDPPRGRCFVMSVREAICKIKISHIVTLEKYTKEGNILKEDLTSTSRMLRRTLEMLGRSCDSISHVSAECLEELKKQKEMYETELAGLDKVLSPLSEVEGTFIDARSPQEILVLMKDSNDCQLAFESYLGKTERRETPNFLDIILGKEKNLREFLEKGNEVYGVYEEEPEGEKEKEKTEDKALKWSPVKYKDGHLHLYSLRNETLPSTGLKIPYEILRELVPCESPTIFFEVGWRGERKGYVYTRMFGNTARSRQTVFLCSGEKGPTYRNTSFFKDNGDISDVNSLCGGDYENNDGTGGRAVLTGITSGHPYVHDITAGLYVSWPARQTWRLAQFDIYLEDSPDGYDRSAHGIVEEGLDILKEAATINPLSDASVMDCGLVIPD